jgi:uncharacterized membrane protein YagU involved in acid resistance
MKPNIGKSILGGFVGTLAMTLMMYKIGPMMGMMKMDIAAMLGNMLGGWNMGMMMHFINGTIIFPLIYAFLLFHLLPGAPAVKGLTWGAILWLLAQLMVMPMMGGGIFSSKMGGMTAVAGSLVGHIVYGALLGLIAGAGEQSRTVAQRAS